MKLREIAHSRTGDKGNSSNISLIAYRSEDYPLLLQQVTAERVKALFAGVVEGEVVRYELPNIAALNFVMSRALGGGVTRSLAQDAHGKSLSYLLLGIALPRDGGGPSDDSTLSPKIHRIHILPSRWIHPPCRNIELKNAKICSGAEKKWATSGRV